MKSINLLAETQATTAMGMIVEAPNILNLSVFLLIIGQVILSNLQSQ